ncbi:MAG: tripartite tricarboxylate transporter permease [Methanomicrobia archaeon]|nr:tripartite tricarboxylate transporter permease [Methanomicrobia archaeon]
MLGAWEAILYTLIGVGLGTVTGLIPGIHVNTLIPFFYIVNPSFETCIVIVALMITHTFLDFIPSTLLGIPDETTALTVLPTHRMLLEGRGLEAIKLTAVGSLGSMLVSFLIFFPVYAVMPLVYSFLYPRMGYFLILISVLLILTERGIKILYSLFVYFLSGILGYIILNSHILPEDQKLFPVFTGLFGLSILFFSLKNKNSFPVQPLDFKLLIPKMEILKSIIKGSLAGMFVAFFPGLGNAQATVLVQIVKLKKKIHDSRAFIIACSGVNTSNAIFSLLALYTIRKPRSGAIIAIQKIIEIDRNTLLIFLSVILISSGIAVFLNLYFGKVGVCIIQKIPYTKLCILIFTFLILLIFLFTGFIGLLVLVTSLAIGILPHIFGIKKSHCMGVLLFPIILYYLR